MTDLLAKLSGYKTYIATMAWVAFEILLVKHAITLDPETAQAIRVGLLGTAGLSLRAAVQKSENAAK